MKKPAFLIVSTVFLVALVTLVATGQVSAQNYDFTFTGSLGDVSGELSGYTPGGANWNGVSNYFQVTSGSATITTGTYAGDNLSFVGVTSPGIVENTPGNNSGGSDQYYVYYDDELFPSAAAGDQLDDPGLLFSVNGLAGPELLNLFAKSGQPQEYFLDDSPTSTDTGQTSGSGSTFTLTPAPTPEPSELVVFAVLGCGLAGLLLRGRMKRQSLAG